MSKKILDRLFSKTIQVGDCLIWQGHITNSGYGLMHVDGKNQSVHRVSYILNKGEITAGMHVMHTCDNRRCVNPEHLVLGTPKQNQHDMIAKGRAKKSSGQNHHLSKLTQQQADEIRKRFVPYGKENGSMALAREFGVRQSTIYAIISRKTWNQS